MTSDEAINKPTSWYATALTCLGDGVITADTKGKVTFLNPAAERLTGWTQAQAVGQDITTVYPTMDTATGEAVSHLLLNIAGGEVVEARGNKVLLGRDGTHHHIKDNVAPIQEAGEPVTGVIVVFSDATALYTIEHHNELLKRDRHLMFYDLKEIQLSCHSHFDMNSREDDDLCWFAVMALNYVNHALAGMEDHTTVQTQSGTMQAVLVHNPLYHLISVIQSTIRHRPIHLECAQIHLPTRRSTSVANIVNAAISHAFRCGRGNIEVRLELVGDEVHLDVYDDGASLSNTVDPHQQTYLLWEKSATELQVIESLVSYGLKGRFIEMPEAGGGRVHVAFPLEEREITLNCDVARKYTHGVSKSGPSSSTGAAQ